MSSESQHWKGRDWKVSRGNWPARLAWSVRSRSQGVIVSNKQTNKTRKMAPSEKYSKLFSGLPVHTHKSTYTLVRKCAHTQTHTHMYARIKRKNTKLGTTMLFMACLASEATKCHLRHIPAFRCPVTESSSHLMGEELSSKSPGKDSREAVDILQGHQVLC